MNSNHKTISKNHLSELAKFESNFGKYIFKFTDTKIDRIQVKFSFSLVTIKLCLFEVKTIK